MTCDFLQILFALSQPWLLTELDQDPHTHTDTHTHTCLLLTEVLAASALCLALPCPVLSSLSLHSGLEFWGSTWAALGA